MFRCAIILFVLLEYSAGARTRGIGGATRVREAGSVSRRRTRRLRLGTLVFTAGPYTLIVFLLDTKEVGARVSKTDKSMFTDAEMKMIGGRGLGSAIGAWTLMLEHRPGVPAMDARGQGNGALRQGEAQPALSGDGGGGQGAEAGGGVTTVAPGHDGKDHA